MSSDDARQETLRAFGLSDYLSRAYLALLELGTTDARSVSRRTSIPIAKVYGTLDALHERGLAEISPDNPKTYTPIPFSVFLERTIRAREEATRDLVTKEEELLALFPILGTTQRSSRGTLTTIRGRRNVMERLREACARATRTIHLDGSSGLLLRASHLRRQVEKAHKRGVEVTILAHLDASNLATAETIHGAEIRAKTNDAAAPTNVLFAIFDGETALLANFEPDDESTTAGKDVGILTDHAALVDALDGIVLSRWRDGEALRARKERLRRGDRPAFTRIQSSQEQICEITTAALGRVTDSYRACVGTPASMLVAPDHRFTADLDKCPPHTTLLLHIDTAAAAAALGCIQEAKQHVRFRHVDHVTTRFAVFDHDETLFTALRPRASEPSGPTDLFVHTNDQGTVQTMTRVFDEMWEKALPLNERRRELETHPAVRPRELDPATLFHSLPEPVLVLHKDNRVLLANPAARELLQGSAHEPERMRLRDLAGGSLSGGRTVSTLTRANGARADIEIVVVPLPAECADGADRLAYVRDITAERQVELAHRERLAFAQAAVEIGKIAYWEWDVVTGQIVWSEKIYELLGLDPNTVQPSIDAFRERIHPDDVDKLSAEVEKDLRGKGTSLHRYRIVRPDGEVRELCARRVLIPGNDGSPRKVLGVVLDVTE